MSEEFRKDAIKGLMSDIEIVLSDEYRAKHESKDHPEWNIGALTSLGVVESLFHVLKNYLEV